MFVRPRNTLVALVLLFVGSASWAANITIHASNFSFSPADVTINAGDTVTFVDDNGFHNVVAGDGSFRCASGCDGEGGNGAPASGWSFVRQFSGSGTLAYFCEVHGTATSGMHGSITVNAVQPTINLGGYLSGNWYDPSPNQAGHGFQLEFTNAPGVTAGNKVLVAIWFVFTPDGNPQWVYGQGEWNPNTNTATIPAEIYTGAKFPPNYNFNDRQQLTFPPGWGTLTFTFSGCNDGTASWDPSPTALGMGYGSGTLPIKRLTQIDGTTCPQ